MNDLTDPSVTEPLSGNAVLNGVPVTLEPVLEPVHEPVPEATPTAPPA